MRVVLITTYLCAHPRTHTRYPVNRTTLTYPHPRVYPNAEFCGTIDAGEMTMTKTLALFMTSAGILTLGGTIAAAGIAVLIVWALTKDDPV